jgi:hypothetical protein
VGAWEFLPSKQAVAGSSPVSRFFKELAFQANSFCCVCNLFQHCIASSTYSSAPSFSLAQWDEARPVFLEVDLVVSCEGRLHFFEGDAQIRLLFATQPFLAICHLMEHPVGSRLLKIPSMTSPVGQMTHAFPGGYR